MKKDLISIILLISFMVINFIAYAASAAPIQCRMTADDYATEALLNRDYVDYNLDSLKNAENILKYNGEYILKSFYGNNLYTILSEQEDASSKNPSKEKFLSVRLQIPLNKVEENISYLRITSFKRFSYAGLSNNAKGWVKVCDEKAGSCVFEKDDISITIEKKADVFSGYIDFLNPQFDACYNAGDCSGKCMFFSPERICISKNIVEDIDNLVLSIGIANNFDDFVMSRKTEQGTYSISKLVPQNNGTIKLEDAMKEELLWLKGQDIIHITERDIAEISILSGAGKVEENRVFYGINEADSLSWTYHINEKSRIAGNDDCSEFPPQKTGITGFIAFDTKLLAKTYVLTPLIFIGFIVLLILVLFITAKIVSRRNTVRIRRVVSE